jgi:hypothetical protein
MGAKDRARYVGNQPQSRESWRWEYRRVLCNLDLVPYVIRPFTKVRDEPLVVSMAKRLVSEDPFSVVDIPVIRTTSQMYQGQ